MAVRSPRPAEPQPAQARPAALKLAAAAGGGSASTDALRRLHASLAELRAEAVVPMLQEALSRLRAHDVDGATEWAKKALKYDDANGYAWQVLAIAREKATDFGAAVQAYERALALMPDSIDLVNDLGRLAYRLEMLPVAEKLFSKYLVGAPGAVEGVNNLACVLRDQSRFGEAIELIRPVLNAEPDHPMLWNTLGTVLSEQGDMAQSLIFFDEALRLDPAFVKARYNRANAQLSMGRTNEALRDVDAALALPAPPDEVAMMSMARATILIAGGDLARGWDAYEVRLDPMYAEVTRFLADRPRCSPADPLAGRRLLVVGEQGLGDEIMFASVVPDVLEALGPEGTLILAVEPRLVPLFQRSYPGVRVEPHGTFRVGHQIVRTVLGLGEWEDVDLWTPIASLPARFRPALAAFPDRAAYLAPDPARVEHWRRELAGFGPGPKVGVLWKSLKLDAGRSRYFSPFEQWRPILTTPGVTFVNLQYGDCVSELAEAQARLGVTIHQPARIDLKTDLDDVAALTCALDLVLGPANATSNIAGACGAPVWLISTPGAWPRLGTDRYPWYPSVRVFSAPAYNDWAPVMAEVAGALAGVASAGTETPGDPFSA